MLRLPLCLGLGILGLTLIVGSGTSQDKKDTPKGAKGMLPPGWKDLELTKEQVLQIYGVQEKFKAKIKALEEQIKTLRAQEKQEMVKVLTPAQKAALVKLTTGEGTSDKKTEKKPDKDKD